MRRVRSRRAFVSVRPRQPSMRLIMRLRHALPPNRSRLNQRSRSLRLQRQRHVRRQPSGEIREEPHHVLIGKRQLPLGAGGKVWLPAPVTVKVRPIG
jgi:hypothetical protein